MKLISVNGSWKKGLVLDDHILKSTYLGNDNRDRAQFETTRTDLGNIIFTIKYRRNHNSNYQEVYDEFVTKFTEIVSKDVINFVNTNNIDVILGAPFSTERNIQPVDLLCNFISKITNIPYEINAFSKKTTTPSKDMSTEEKSDLSNQISSSTVLLKQLEGKNILIIDDLYETGSTLEACTKYLQDNLSYANVYVLSMTKTKPKGWFKIKKIFIAGPIAIKKLDENVEIKLLDLYKKKHQILVGDAKGVDILIQNFYKNLEYKNLTVYVSGRKTRNNIFNWDTNFIDVDKGVSGFNFYSQKDKAMAHDSDYGFMIWNGKSRGTLNNMINLLSEKKSVLLYLTFNQQYHLIDNKTKLDNIIYKCEDKTKTIYKSLLKKNDYFNGNNDKKEEPTDFEQLSLDMYTNNNNINK